MNKMTTSDIAPLPSPSTDADVVDTTVSGAVAAEAVTAETTAVDESWKTKLRAYGFVSALVVDDAFAPVEDDEVGGRQKATFKEYIEDNAAAQTRLYSLLGISPESDTDRDPNWEQDVFGKIDVLWEHSQKVNDELKDALEHLFDAVITDRLSKRAQVEQVIEVLKKCDFEVITSHMFDANDPKHLTADILFVDLYVDRKILDGDTAAAVKASAPIVREFLEKSTGIAGGAWRTEKCLPPVFVISSHSDVLDITSKMVEAGVKRSCIRSMHKSDAEQELEAEIKLIETYAPLALTWQSFKQKMNAALETKVRQAVEQLDDLDIREVALLYKATIEPSSEDFEPYLGWLWGESISTKLYEAGIEAAGSIDFPAELPIVVDGKADVRDTFVQLYEESSVVYQGLDKTQDGKYTAQVSFGDLFILAAQNDGRDLLTIFAVMSRACDVVRAECDMNILCRLTDAKKIKDKRELEVARNLLEGLTRFISIGPTDKYLINFAKNTAVQTITFGDLNNRDKYLRIGRLSPLQALQLQQLLLADFGRVGTPSALGFLDAFDAQVQVLHLGKRIATFNTPPRQFYSAITYKYRDGKNGDALKIAFTSAFVTFLRESLAGMQNPYPEPFKEVRHVLAAINKAPAKNLKFELDISSDAALSYSLISEGRLQVYVVGEPKEYVEPPAVLADATAQPPSTKPKQLEIAILLTPQKQLRRLL